MNLYITTLLEVILIHAGFSSAWAIPQAQIYFVRYNDNLREHGTLYRMNVDGSRQNRVVALNGTDPTFSPDGRKVMFQSNHALLRKGKMFTWHECIWIMDLDDTKVTQVAGYDSYGPVFSPNGKMLAFMSGYRDPHGPDHEFDIVVKDVGSPKLRFITKSREANDTYPSFTPDSKKILFASGSTPSGLSAAYGELEEENRDIYSISRSQDWVKE